MLKRKKNGEVIYGGVPRVDLLPEQQRAELIHESVLPRLLIYTLLAAVVAAAVWLAGMVPVSNAEMRLAKAENRSEELVREIASYKHVQDALNSERTLGREIETLSENIVYFAPLRNEIVEHLPGEAELVGYSFSLHGSNPENIEMPTASGELNLDPLCLGT